MCVRACVCDLVYVCYCHRVSFGSCLDIDDEHCLRLLLLLLLCRRSRALNIILLKSYILINKVLVSKS